MKSKRVRELPIPRVKDSVTESGNQRMNKLESQKVEESNSESKSQRGGVRVKSQKVTDLESLSEVKKIIVDETAGKSLVQSHSESQ